MEKLNCKSIMIGDWVMHDNRPKQVMTIWSNEVSLNDTSKTYGSIYADKFPIEDISPIPLTPEILEKNGFILEQNDYVYYAIEGNKYQNYICVNFRHNGEPRVVEFSFVNKVQCAFNNIVNVHELQHALRLCGIEKEIVL